MILSIGKIKLKCIFNIIRQILTVAKEEIMKDCMLLGIAVGMIAGAMVYRYSLDVQKLADKGENMVKQEVQKIKKAGSSSVQKDN